MYVGAMDSDGKREGIGKLFYSNGDVYEGEWMADERHGTGTMVYHAIGAVFEGCFQHGVRHGYGTLSYANGDSYSGAWEEDTKQGVGRFCWAQQKSVYEGQFQCGAMHGRGKYTFADGCVYEGEYANGERHGRGVLILPDGTRESGEWHGFERQPSKKEVASAAPSFRPDLAIKIDPKKERIQKMLQIEAKIESLQLEALHEDAPTGEWDSFSP